MGITSFEARRWGPGRRADGQAVTAQELRFQCCLMFSPRQAGHCADGRQDRPGELLGPAFEVKWTPGVAGILEEVADKEPS
jgi:hypothetical protein